MHRLLLVLAAFGVMLAVGSSVRGDETQFYLSTNESGGTIPAGAVLVTVQTDTGGATIAGARTPAAGARHWAHASARPDCQCCGCDGPAAVRS